MSGAGIPSDLRREYPALGEWAIIVAYRGSIAHGMYVPSSDPHSVDDKDAMTIVVPPVDYYCGLSEFGSRGTQEIVRGEWDIVSYEARKAIRLLAKGNPNVLSLLWLPESGYMHRTAAGRLLIENRDLFVGKHVYKSFVGYASAQLTRLERGAYKGYMGDKRKALVETFGYDPKNAAHLIRLLRMGIEFLSTGDLLVQRPDAPELLAIKNGEWELDRIKSTANELFKLAQEAHVRSPLPIRVDMDAINRLTIEIVQIALAATPQPNPESE